MLDEKKGKNDVLKYFIYQVLKTYFLFSFKQTESQTKETKVIV